MGDSEEPLKCIIQPQEGIEFLHSLRDSQILPVAVKKASRQAINEVQAKALTFLSKNTPLSSLAGIRFARNSGASSRGSASKQSRAEGHFTKLAGSYIRDRMSCPRTNRSSIIEEQEAERAKQVEAQRFVRCMKQKTSDWKSKFRRHYIKELERFQEELEKKEERWKQSRDEELVKRKYQRINQFKAMKQKRDDNISRNREHEKAFKTPSSYLYQQLEEQYVNDFVLPALNSSKATLRERQRRFQQVTREELLHHQHKVKNYLEERERLRARLNERETSEDSKRREEQRKYDCSWWKRVNEEEERQKEDMHNKIQHRMRTQERMKHYNEVVKDLYPVKTSPEKSRELRSIVESLQSQARKPRSVKNEYVTLKRNYEDPVDEPKKMPKIMPRGKSEEKLKSIKRYNKKIDYLSSIKEEREKKYISMTPSACNLHINLDESKLNSAKGIENAERMITDAENKLRNQMRLYEMYKHVQTNDTSREESISNSFISVIKAKLQLLSHF
eukprot:TRINITY_DN4787_c0_g4_i2.p1 TRINITY_DN4787_c0_g4~~TRINITY_DN4787_c0_g4_i2.p1  ORF type:complete len:503 (-),score=156.18 TRINITY_DN4787_c0_g4_i2:123-1631(-)